MKRDHWIVSVIWLISLCGVMMTPRDEFYSLWSFYSIAFISYIWLVWKTKSIPLIPGLALAFLCRSIAFGFDPLLSDDFYRFIWDGFVLHQGINPVAYTPAELINGFAENKPLLEIFNQLNSREYHSVYPPFPQLVFYLSYAINGLNSTGQIIFYKIVLFLADVAVVYLLAALLKQIGKPRELVLIYALNPLIIVEYMGNLHFDNIMLAGLLVAIYFIRKNIFISSLFMAFSISTKLLSMILMPFIPREGYWKKMSILGAISVLLTFGGFYLLFKTDTGWLKSVSLWFNSFEFNASFYYLAQWFYKALKGYEDIAIIGPVMALGAAILIAGIWLVHLQKNKMHWAVAMVVVVMVYYLMSTTVHPWYIGPLLALGVISGLSFPVVWTYLIFLSYSHYIDGGFSENYLLIATEYALLFLFIIWEIFLGAKTTE